MPDEARPGSRSPTSPPRSTAPQPGMKGICLRGQPGWGQVFAPLTTVVNTFGGTWFDKDWNAQVNAPEFKEATNFYVDLVQAARRGRGAAGRLHRVPERPGAGQGRHVVRRHLRRRLARGRRLPGQGQDRLRPGAGRARPSPPAGSTPGRGPSRRPARTRTTRGSSSPGPPSKDYEELVGKKLGWSKVPAGKRASTYANPDYLKAAAAFAEPTEDRDRDRRPERTPASSRGRRSASSSSTSRSSPTWAPRSPQDDQLRDRRQTDASTTALNKASEARPRQVGREVPRSDGELPTHDDSRLAAQRDRGARPSRRHRPPARHRHAHGGRDLGRGAHRCCPR